MAATQRCVAIGDGEAGVSFGNDLPIALISGPCQTEGTQHSIDIAGHLAEICAARGIDFVFKASFDKANRTSLSGQRGRGLADGLADLAAVKAEIGCPVLTDVHLPDQCAEAAEVCDILQIPAFLCRQTDLLVAAAETGKAVNVKKGQFLSPWEMPNVAEKVAASGNDRILLTERGTSFGYNTLVTDMRALPQMAATGYPVIFDATHSVQQPGGRGGSSGGQREFAPVLARAAVAVGIAGLFIETHPTPATAPSDGPNMIPLDQMAGLLDVLKSIDVPAKASPVRLD
jgi:2-dehydro-3-deoxyphosphooctonate aldolase (KDO 8-P synthase)